MKSDRNTEYSNTHTCGRQFLLRKKDGFGIPVLYSWSWLNGASHSPDYHLSRSSAHSEFRFLNSGVLYTQMVFHGVHGVKVNLDAEFLEPGYHPLVWRFNTCVLNVRVEKGQSVQDVVDLATRLSNQVSW